MRARVEIQQAAAGQRRRNYRRPPPRSLMPLSAMPARMRIFHDEDGINWYHVIAALGWAMFALGIAGEFLGWWNQLGEILSVSGFAAGLLSPMLSSGRKQVRAGFDRLDASILGVDRKLGKLDSMDAKLGKLDSMDAKLGKLDSMDAKLGKLDSMDAKLGKLDSMDQRLDAHTALLRDIRDALRDLRDRPA